MESRRFIEIVEGRLQEIIENVWFQIPSEYYDKLLGGIILTGGGSNMKNIEKAFTSHTHVERIRIAKFPQQTINSTNEDIKSRNGMMNTILGLLAKGDMNCAGLEIDPHGDLFGAPKQTATVADRTVRRASEIPAGVIQTEAEKQKAEELKRQQEAEEQARREAEERARKEEEERIRKENSAWNKFKKGFSNFGKKILEDE